MACAKRVRGAERRSPAGRPEARQNKGCRGLAPTRMQPAGATRAHFSHNLSELTEPPRGTPQLVVVFGVRLPNRPWASFLTPAVK